VECGCPLPLLNDRPTTNFNRTQEPSAALAVKNTISEINLLSGEEFVRLIGPVFEHSPWIAQTTEAWRPFASLEQLHARLCETVRNAAEEKQLELIRAHPDLVGRAALAGTLTPASNAEQASAGLNRLTVEEIAAFQESNAAYRNKFGFPFVICARLNKKEAILAGFKIRLKNSREQEIQTALEEIFKIARLRLEDILG
jgi:2-oxo-4-hydroxy-4-carboxy-5-ureidoimidazoline decarboxylase